MNGHMTVGTLRIASPEAEMENRQRDVAAQALVLHLLEGQHVPVRGTMWIVAGGAPFHLQAAMLK